MKLKTLISIILSLTVAVSCKIDDPSKGPKNPGHVFLMYSAGYNSLSNYLREDINDLKNGYIPGNKEGDDVMLVYSHLTDKYGSYDKPVSPVLFRMYKNKKGRTICDTLYTFPAETRSSSKETFNQTLSLVKNRYPSAKSYGMILSSHATGYLPSGYYSNSSKYESGGITLMDDKNTPEGAVEYVAPDFDPSLPAVKSIMQDRAFVNGGDFSYEMDLRDFADAIPMKLEYILVDACLMGGIEFAYQIKNKCNKVAFSQTEVLADGLNYKTLAGHLLGRNTPDVESVCKDYFEQYDVMTGVYRSATYSLIDCTRLDGLAILCRELFEEYRHGLNSIDAGKVQRYYRSNYHWFYDLESILIEAGMTPEDHTRLKDALNDCIIYKAATPAFMNEFDINTYSGFSMFLPRKGGDYLKAYYTGLAWNEATNLVEI